MVDDDELVLSDGVLLTERRLVRGPDHFPGARPEGWPLTVVMVVVACRGRQRRRCSATADAHSKRLCGVHDGNTTLRTETDGRTERPTTRRTTEITRKCNDCDRLLCSMRAVARATPHERLVPLRGRRP